MFLSLHAASLIYSLSTAPQQEDDITQHLSNETRRAPRALPDDEREHGIFGNYAGDMANNVTSQADM